MIPFRLSTLGILMALAPALAAAQLPQRSISPQEYIQSVSPLAGGGSVISRSAPGQNVQTITTIAQLPTSSSRNSAVGYQPRTIAGQWNQTQLAGNPNPMGSAATAGYAYPTANSAPQRPTNTLGLEPLGSRAFQQTRLFQSATPNYQVAQNCPTCVGGTSTSYPIPNFSPIQSGTPINPPATLAAPNLMAPQPVLAPEGAWPGMQYNPNLGFNSPVTPGYNSGRVNYTPLFALRNLPPGTYVGQGLLGQPKAYIDGEPVRNLLRYLSY